MESFVYVWRDAIKKMYYIGKHKGNKDDNYISSSSYFNKEYTQRPFDFSRKIIKSGTDEEMFNFETKLLQRVNAANNPKFYNKYNNRAKFFNNGSEEIKERQIQTWMHTLGVDNPSKSQCVRDKMSKTALTPEVQSKKRKTLQERYGVDFPSQHPEFRLSTQSTWKEKYGVEEILSSGTDTRARQDQTRLERYGSTSVMGTDYMLEKSKETWKEKYGVDNPYKSKEIKEKIRQKHIERYGVDNPAKSPTVKALKRQRMYDRANLDFESLIKYITANYKYTKKTRDGKTIINSAIYNLLKYRTDSDIEQILQKLKDINSV